MQSRLLGPSAGAGLFHGIGGGPIQERFGRLGKEISKNDLSPDSILDESAEDLIRGPGAPRSPFDGNMALARDKGTPNERANDRDPENRRRIKQVQKAGNYQRTRNTMRFNPESGGYKFLTNEEFERYSQGRDEGPRHMRDIRDSNGRGRWVYMQGVTNLTGDNLGASQEEVWYRMSPQERYEYVNARLMLRDMKRTAGVIEPDRRAVRSVQRRTGETFGEEDFDGFAGPLSDPEVRFRVAQRANALAVNAQHRWLIDQMNDGADGGDVAGGFFDSDRLTNRWEGALGAAPNFLIWQDVLPNGQLGFMSIMSLDEAFDSIRADVATDPYMAAELIISMLNANYIGGAQAIYSDQYVGTDAEGRPIATWNPADYDEPLQEMIRDIAGQQAMEQGPDNEQLGLWDTLKFQASVAQDVINTDTGGIDGDGGGFGGGGWVDFGGGGGYGGFGGYGGYGDGGFGGGGGEGGSVFLTDPTAITSMLDGIARARLGRTLSTDEVQAFIAHFHQLQTAYSQAYNSGAGATLTQPDLEGQAVAWIEGRYAGEQQGEDEGQYISALAAFLRGPGLGSGGSGGS